MAEAIVVRPGEGDTVQGPVGGPLRFLARGEGTGGALAAVENVIPPGEGPPLHTHSSEDEFWFVIEGELRFTLGDAEEHAPTGTFVFVPRGTPHNFTNPGQEDARILVMFTPAGMERFFDRFAEATDEPPPERFRSVGGELGMDVVGPPLRG